MPAYLIQHPAEQRREDILIEDDDLTLAFTGGWAVFADGHGVCPVSYTHLTLPTN